MPLGYYPVELVFVSALFRRRPFQARAGGLALPGACGGAPCRPTCARAAREGRRTRGDRKAEKKAAQREKKQAGREELPPVLGAGSEAKEGCLEREARAANSGPRKPRRARRRDTRDQGKKAQALPELAALQERKTQTRANSRAAKKGRKAAREGGWAQPATQACSRPTQRSRRAGGL